MKLLRPPSVETYERMSQALKLQVAQVLTEQAGRLEQERYDALVRSGAPMPRSMTAEAIYARLPRDPAHLTAQRRRDLEDDVARLVLKHRERVAA